MNTEQNKLYRSNINFMPVTISAPRDFNTTAEYGLQMKFQRKNSHQNTLTSTASQANLKFKQLNRSIQGSKETMSFLNAKEIQNQSFISIDDAYLNPKFQKKKDQPKNRILPNNITDLQSDTESLGGRSIRTYQGQQDYYKYWKTKAHEYLEENFKLREENKKLKDEIQTVKQQSIKQLSSNQKIEDKSDTIDRENKSFAYLENIFKKKLDELQNQLKQKTLRIISLEDKVLELNTKIIREEERTQLIQRLGTQIETLTQQNIFLKNHVASIQLIPTQSIQDAPLQKGAKHNYRYKEKSYLNQTKLSRQKSSKK